MPNLEPLFSSCTQDSVIVGDFNAHNELWYSYMDVSWAVARDSHIAAQIMSSPFCVLNDNTPTRLPSSGPPFSPDISLASLLTPCSQWQMVHQDLSQL